MKRLRRRRHANTALPEAHSHECLIDARLHLLDRQIIDCDGKPVGVIDDIELDYPADDGSSADGQAPRTAALLSGNTLPTRLFGGSPPLGRLTRISIDDIDSVEVAARLSRQHDELDRTWAERWVRDQIIRRIPGGSHDPR